MDNIHRVAVLGAGTMGAQIAALFANVGIPAVLLDLRSSEGSPNARALNAVAKMQKQQPSPFYLPDMAERIQCGTFEDNLGLLQNCDWIIEAVAEDLDIKRAIWEQASPHCQPNAVLSTNTSGLRLAAIAGSLPPPLRRRFLGVHFFNPPRYLHLLEVVPGPDTDPSVLQFVTEFGERILGKGIVRCKDTPNFIANRIGSFYSATVQRVMMEGNYTIEEADLLTGPLIGVPKSASFRLIDLIGLDVWTQVARNVYDHTDDAWRDRFYPLPYTESMLQKGWLGDKAGQGFYRRWGPEKQLQVLDWRTLQYRPVQTAAFDSVSSVNRSPDLVERVRTLIGSEDRAGQFVWRVLRDVFAYSIAMIPEISDRTVEIDRAMRWGFGHQLGPFELWDGLGFEHIAHRIENDRIPLSTNVTRLIAAKAGSFYRGNQYFDFASNLFRQLEPRPGVVVLNDCKRADGEVDRNAEASLVDLGDGVLCLEFHSKMNIISGGTLEMIERGLEKLSSDFEALVIANEGPNFSAGANLAALLGWAQAGEFTAIEAFIRRFQYALFSLKYSPKPVVAAAFSRALGGGCEVVLQSHRVQALAELYMGLVELNVGLIPAGGGTKEMAVRFSDPVQALDLVAKARVSGSAAEAQAMGLLRREDRVTTNPELLIGDAKSFALELAETQASPTKRPVRVSGSEGYGKMMAEVTLRKRRGALTEHDAVVLEKLAHVISGGGVSAGSAITEERLLELEREVFLSLCGMPKTQERIQHVLQSGKPLKN